MILKCIETLRVSVCNLLCACFLKMHLVHIYFHFFNSPLMNASTSLTQCHRYTIYKDHITLEDYEIHDGMGLEL